MALLSRTEWMRANRGTTTGGGFQYEGPERERQWNDRYEAYKKAYNDAQRNTVPSSADTATGKKSGSSSTATTSQAILEGLPAREYDPATGGIPQVTPPSESQAEAILSNLKNLPQLIELSRLMDESNLERLRAQYEKSFPGYAKTEKQISENIAAGARGELSPGVLANLQQTAAERGVALGMPSVRGGNTLANTTLLRMLGNTTEQLQANALNQLGQYNATSPRVGLYNPASMFISPQEQSQSQWLANLLNSAPVPWQNQQAALDAVRAGMGTGFNAGRANIGYPTSQMPTMPTGLMDIFRRYAPTSNLQQQIQQPGAYDISSKIVYPIGENWTPNEIAPYTPADYQLQPANYYQSQNTLTEYPQYLPQRNFGIEENTDYYPVDANAPTEYPVDLWGMPPQEAIDQLSNPSYSWETDPFWSQYKLG